MFSAILNNPITKLIVILLVFGIFVGIIISFLPDIPFDGEFQNAFIWLFGTLWSFDWLLPINTMITCLVLVITAEFSVMILRFYLWIKDSIIK